MVEESRWIKRVKEDPNHSHWYVERFRKMVLEGDDLAGEARLIDAMVPRGARILDAGCGSGRVGAYLSEAGHDVVGVDVDPVLIAAAEEDHPGPVWLLDDLAEVDLFSRGVSASFDAIVCAGNVMTFLAPSTRQVILGRLAAYLAPGGRIAVGFGTNRGYHPDEYFSDVEASGLVPELIFSTWDLRPFTEDSDFIVTILRTTPITR